MVRTEDTWVLVAHMLVPEENGDIVAASLRQVSPLPLQRGLKPLCNENWFPLLVSLNQLASTRAAMNSFCRHSIRAPSK